MKMLSGSLIVSREWEVSFRDPDRYKEFVRARIAERLIVELLTDSLISITPSDSPEGTLYTYSLRILEESDFAPRQQPNWLS